MKNTQFVDIRSASQFQENHVRGSLSLNLKNFAKYGDYLLSKENELQLIVDENTKQDAEKMKENKAFQWSTEDKEIIAVPDTDLASSKTISGEEFINLETDYVLLDVRNPNEITRPAPEKNLVNIALEDLPNRLEQLDKSKTIYTLCGSGTRGTTSASFLVNNGYNAVVIKGGIVAIYKAQEKQAN